MGNFHSRPPNRLRERAWLRYSSRRARVMQEFLALLKKNQKALAQIDTSLRDMMGDAAALPIPAHLRALVSTLEQEGDAPDPGTDPQRWEGRGA